MNRCTGQRIRQRRAMTLTEVVVASALLIAGLVPILRALTIAEATSRKIEQKTRSLSLAQAKLARCRAEAAASYTTSLAESNVVLESGYLATVTDDEDATLKTVSVSVGFDRDGDGSLASSEQLVTLTSAIAKR